MKRTKLKDRILPNYTKGEEICNMVTHIVGAVFSIVAIILLPIFATIHRNLAGIIGGIIFGISMLILYCMSSIYHGLSPKLKGKKVLQILDHCAIFIFIAGSYTPMCLCTLMEYSPTLAWSIFGIVWFLAILGVIFNSIDLKKYKVFSMICYLLMGWCIAFKAPILPKLLTTPGFILLLTEGIIYTVGAILYIAGKKHKYIHSVFHLTVLFASIIHFFCILFYVI